MYFCSKHKSFMVTRAAAALATLYLLDEPSSPKSKQTRVDVVSGGVLCRYNLTRFATWLNELTPPGLEQKLAPTDCRLRPDQHCLEQGVYDQVLHCPYTCSLPHSATEIAAPTLVFAPLCYKNSLPCMALPYVHLCLLPCIVLPEISPLPCSAVLCITACTIGNM